MSIKWTTRDDIEIMRIIEEGADVFEVATKIRKSTRAVRMRAKALGGGDLVQLQTPSKKSKSFVRIGPGIKYIISGQWGDAVCTFERRCGKHLVFKSIKSGCRYSFTESEIENGVPSNSLREA